MTGTRRGAGLLAAGSAGSGLLAYGVFAVVTRTLGPEAAAPVSVLWTWWGFAAAAVTFPIQHWTTRSISAHGEASVRACPRAGPLSCWPSRGRWAASWLGREALFHSTSAAFPAMVALLTLGSGLVGLNRGALAARGRFAAVGASLVAENGLRLVAVCVLAGADVQNAVAYGLCLVLGYLAALAWPGALRFADGPQSAAGSPFAFLAGAGFGQLVSQVVLTGGPVVLALSGGSAVQVTSLFAALALFRAPYLLAEGSVAPLTVRLTGWVSPATGRR